MRSFVVLVVLSLATPAAAQSIYPNGGAVHQVPTLWISASRRPAIEVTDRSGPVVFEIDEMRVEHGPRRIALRPQVTDGPFTVTLDGKRFRFDADAGLARSDQAFHDVVIQRVAIERLRGHDTLVIDAIAEPNTILYFHNHSSPQNRQPVFARYLWSGPGKTIERGRDGGNGTQRFELQLAELGVSCGSTADIELSAYTTNLSGGKAPHPIGKLRFANGKVRLPVQILGRHHGDAEWLDCIGASVKRKLVPRGILSSLDTFQGNDFDDVAIYAGLLVGGDSSPRAVSPELQLPLEPMPDEPRPTWPWSPLFALLMAFLLGHATTRLGS
jgi:hypothetical protein